MIELTFPDIELGEGDANFYVPGDQDSLPPVTIGLYRAFRAKGKRGTDAFLVYSHLLFTYRLQHTDCVRATNTYISRGIGVGVRRVKSAKNLLRSMRLIQSVMRQDKKGRIIGSYTRLNLLPNPGPVAGTQNEEAWSIGAESAPMDKSPILPGVPKSIPMETANKCLKKKGNASSALPKGRARNPEYTAFLHNFRSWYQERTRAAPTWNYGKDGAHLKADLKEYGADRLTRAARLFFSDDCPQAVRKFSEGKGAGYGYGVFRSQLKRGLLEVLDAEDRRLSLIRVCPNCQRTNEHTGQDCIYCGEPLKREARNVAGA